MKSYRNLEKAPRGIRNNNPGNLRVGSNWQGSIPTVQVPEKAFVTFQNYAYGVRAMLLLLLNKHKSGQKTVRQLISSWAPPTENDTNSYVKFVAKGLGVEPDTTLNLDKTTLFKLASSIVQKENGTKWKLETSDFEDAFSLLAQKVRPAAAVAAGASFGVLALVISYFILK